MRKSKFILSKNELQILNTMWGENRPLLRSEIIDLTKDKTWKESSIHILLNQLLKKDAIKIAGFGQVKTNIGRTYTPNISKNEYDYLQLKENILDIKPNIITRLKIIKFLVDSDDYTKNDLDELGKIIDNRRNKLKK